MVGARPVRLIGDGVAVAAAEHWQGAARGYDDALCMVVSTGVGGGLVALAIGLVAAGLVLFLVTFAVNATARVIADRGGAKS